MLNLFKKIFGKKKETDNPRIIVCDASACIYSLDRLKREDHIYIPVLHYSILKKVASGKCIRNKSLEEDIIAKNLAKDALKYINENKDWCTVVPKLENEVFFKEVNIFKVNNQTKSVLGLACHFCKNGNQVYVYTQTKQIRDCVEYQKNDSMYVEYWKMAA